MPDAKEYGSQRLDSTFGTGVGNRYEKYLGPPASNVNISAYDDVPYTNYDLPEYYRGKNAFLRNTIDGFIMDDIEWYTTVCLPWAYTDQLRITYNEWHFNTVYADRVPHEGVSRLVTSSKRQYKDHVVRRGLAFLLEADFYTTPEGDEQYMRNVRGIAQCVQETQNYDTLYALLTCKDTEKIRTQRFGTSPFSKAKIYEEEINDYNCIVQEPGLLDNTVERWRSIMYKHKAYPDMLIVAPGTVLYFSMVTPLQTQYWGIGPDGQMEFKEGPMSMTTFRGLDVFETRDFEINRNEPLVNIMSRPVQIGERYLASFRSYRSKDIYDFRSAWRNIVLYNENTDAMEKVTYREIFLASNLFVNGEHHPAAVKALNDFNEGYRPNNKRRGRSHKPTTEDDPPIMTIGRDSDGVGFLIDRLGQMDLKFAEGKDMIQVAQSILGKMYYRDMEKEEANMTDLVDLIRDMESETYNREYWRLLIEENTPFSVDDGGNFLGETTPDDLLNHWHGLVKVTQWAANAHGSLRLPSKKPEGVIYPAGFSTWAGVLTVGHEGGNPKSPWYSLGQRALKVIKTWKRFAGQLAAYLPDSEAVLAENRSPWFHRADPCATLFDYLIGVKRDPVFLAFLPLVKDREGNTQGESQAKKKKVVGRVTPIYSLDLNYGNLVAGEALALMKEAVESRAATDDKIVFLAPNGTVVTSDARFFKSGVMMSKSIVALRLMGQNSFPALFNLLKRLTPSAEESADSPAAAKLRATKKKLLDYALKLGAYPDNIKKLRASIRSLEEIGNLDELIATIDIISITPEAKKTAQTAAKKKIEALARTFMDASDDDIDAFVNRGITDPLMMVEDASADDVAGYSQVSDLMDDILVYAEQLNTIRVVKGQPRVALDLDDTSNFERTAEQDFDDYTDRYDDITSALSDAVIKVRAIVQTYTSDKSLNEWKQEEDKYHAKDGKKKMFVQDNDAAVKKAKFFRCPLVMTPGLAQSLYGEELPLIRPADPDTGHLLPVMGNERDLDKVFKGPSYIHIDSMTKNQDNMLEQTNFILRHVCTSTKSKSRPSGDNYANKRRKLATAGKKKSGKKGGLLTDSDDSDSDISSDSDDDLGGHDYRRGDPRGRGRGAHTASSSSAYSEKYKQVSCGAMQYRYKEACNITKVLLKLATIAALMSPFDEDAILKMIDSDIYVPLDFVLWRPFIEHDMESAVLLKRGLDTGGNLYGHSNFATGNDVATKMIYGNFTFNSKAMVWKEKNVQIIPNIRSKEYRGGNNLDFILDIKDIDSTGRDRPSVIVTAIPVTETKFDFAMDITGQDRMADLNETIDKRSEKHYSTYEYYERIFGLKRRLSGVNTDKFTYFDEQDRINTLTFQGLQVIYNTETRKYDQVIQCQGHRKRNGSGPGTAAIWNGKGTYFKEQRFAEFSFD